MSKIIEARERLMEMSRQIRSSNSINDYWADEIDKIIALMYRKSIKRVKSERTSTPMTPALARQILNYMQASPETSTREVAEHFNVNQGRVTEVLEGKHL